MADSSTANDRLTQEKKEIAAVNVSTLAHFFAKCLQFTKKKKETKIIILKHDKQSKYNLKLTKKQSAMTMI